MDCKISLVIVLCLSASQTIAADTSPAALFREWGHLTDECRGSSPDLPSTATSCAKLNNTVDRLFKMGWCFGKEDQIAAEFNWHLCSKSSFQIQEANGFPAPIRPTKTTVRCANHGDYPETIDPFLPGRISDWLEDVLMHFGSRLPQTTVEAIDLQRTIQDWASSKKPHTQDSIFAQAVAHGVNVQYEALLLATAKTDERDGQYWINLEAARAQACLNLLQL